jgi:hypothetical protein
VGAWTVADEYYWIVRKPLTEQEAHDKFVLRFGREPEMIEWDENEEAWFLGWMSKKEIRRTRNEGTGLVRLL